MRTSLRSRRMLAGAFVASAATALAAFGMSGPALAQVTGQSSASVERACSQQTEPGVMTCLALRRTGIHPDLPSGYGPSDLQDAYSLPSNGGAGQTVAIVDAYDDPNAASDLAQYRSAFGLPALTNGQFRKVNQNGNTSPLPSGDTGWAGEISLDVDMVSAIAPQANILLVEANTPSMDDLGTAVNTAVQMGAKYVSNSYGGSESGADGQADEQYFNHPGVAITVSTGDDGHGPEYPATSQYVTAVGGTSLQQSSNARGWSESAWSGAGSGCSSYDAKPSWQNVSTGCSRRAEADVSAVADPNTGVAVYQSYGGSGWAVYGGTSASSPIVAAVYALAGAPGANDYPASYPYSHPSDLNDVANGSNGSCGAPMCSAGNGWDGPTGLGTPNGTAAFTSGATNPPGSVTVDNPGSQSTKVATSVNLKLSATGGTAPYTWTASGLPNGLSISSSGTITGSPSKAGSYTVKATATDADNKTGSTTFSWTITTSGGGSCPGGQLLGNNGFETGTAAPWSTTPGVVSSNADGGVAHNGNYYAWLDGYGQTHTDTLSQSVTVPSGCSTVTLSFYLYVATQESGAIPYDTLSVQANGSTVASYSNADASNGYVHQTVTASATAGSALKITFTGTEDVYLATSFLIDDTSLTVS